MPYLYSTSDLSDAVAIGPARVLSFLNIVEVSVSVNIVEVSVNIVEVSVPAVRRNRTRA